MLEGSATSRPGCDPHPFGRFSPSRDLVQKKTAWIAQALRTKDDHATCLPTSRHAVHMRTASVHARDQLCAPGACSHALGCSVPARLSEEPVRQRLGRAMDDGRCAERCRTVRTPRIVGDVGHGRMRDVGAARRQTIGSFSSPLCLSWSAPVGVCEDQDQHLSGPCTPRHGRYAFPGARESRPSRQ